MSNIIDIHRFRYNSDLCRDLEETLSKYAGIISMAEAIGSLEITKQALVADALEASDDCM